MNTPNAVPSATCQRGMVGGRVKGIRKPVTKKPSLISCPRITAKATSMAPPTAKQVMKIGKKYNDP